MRVLGWVYENKHTSDPKHDTALTKMTSPDPTLDHILKEIRSLRRELTNPPQRLVRRDDAAKYLAVGKTYFETQIRPDVPEIKRGGVVLFDKAHLDAWADKYLADSIHDKRLLHRHHSSHKTSSSH